MCPNDPYHYEYKLYKKIKHKKCHKIGQCFSLNAAKFEQEERKKLYKLVHVRKLVCLILKINQLKKIIRFRHKYKLFLYIPHIHFRRTKILLA